MKQKLGYLIVGEQLSKKPSPAEDYSKDVFIALQHLPEELSGVQELLSWHPPKKPNTTASPSLPVQKEMRENVQPPFTKKSNTGFKFATHLLFIFILEGQERLQQVTPAGNSASPVR